MPPTEPLTATVSTKGQIVLPMPIRRALSWSPGTRLIVEQTSTGVLLKPAPTFAPTKASDVFGCLAHTGTPRTIEEMNQSVLDEARRRHARD